MLSRDTSLDRRVALVTGASRKLGATIAAELSLRGARVVVNYNTSTVAAEDLASKLRNEGGEAIAIQADVSDPHAVTRLIDQTLENYGALQILVNNAGPYTDVPFAKLSPDQWDWIINTNIKAAYYASQLAFRSMSVQGWGRVVSISAGSAFVRNHAVFGLAKNALLTLTESLALEFAPQVTVNAVAPGLIDDPQVPAGISMNVQQDTPLRRLVTYQEVADMVCLLCSPAFDAVTGQVIVMDGGQTISRGMIFDDQE